LGAAPWPYLARGQKSLERAKAGRGQQKKGKKKEKRKKEKKQKKEDCSERGLKSRLKRAFQAQALAPGPSKPSAYKPMGRDL
jgi:hypothetical protein